MMSAGWTIDLINLANEMGGIGAAMGKLATGIVIGVASGVALGASFMAVDQRKCEE